MAQDRPFDAKEDISDVAIDIMQATGYGLDDSMSIIKRQLDYLANLKESRPPLDDDGSVQFPRPPPVSAMIASYMIGQHVGRLFKSLFPRALHRFKVLTSASLRKTIAMKDALICSEINKALVRLHSSKGDEIQSAMDSVLQREMDLAGKEMRKPNFHSRAIYDEVGDLTPAEEPMLMPFAASWICRGWLRHQCFRFIMYVVFSSSTIS